jgi:hypothetical protein
MKFDFWFDLPQALVNVTQDTLSNEEKEYSKVLYNSYNSFKNTLDSISNMIDRNIQNFSNEDLEKVNHRINMIKKENAELLCKAVKFSTKVMTKLLSSIETYQSCKITEVELLTKIKLFLKITRVIIENAKIHSQNTKGKEQEFFNMYLIFYIRIHIFTEKVQSRLFNVSNVIIKLSLEKKKREEDNSSQLNYSKIIAIHGDINMTESQ